MTISTVFIFFLSVAAKKTAWAKTAVRHWFDKVVTPISGYKRNKK